MKYMPETKRISYKNGLVLALVVIVVALIVFFIIKIFSPPSIDCERVQSIDLKIYQLYDKDINLTFNDKDSIMKIADLERLVWKNKGTTSSLIKNKPWEITITYHLINEKEIVRTYKGKLNLLELQKAFGFLIDE